MLKIFVSLFLFLFSSYIAADNVKIAVTAIFQNESEYLGEWIDYHHSVGVEHFYLYNNNSTDDFMSVLRPYIDEGVVELIDWPSYQEANDWWHFSFVVQTGAYNDALARARDRFKWLAIIDTDEFIVPVKYDNILELLEKDYSWVSGLAINWQCYGTSDVQKAPSGQMTKLLTRKMRWDHDRNKASKCIVQPLHVSTCPNPHHCYFKNGHWAVNSDFVRTDTCCTYVNIDTVRINHYWTRDEWFLWNVKIARYLRWGQDITRTLEDAALMNEYEDDCINRESLRLSAIR